MDLWDYTSQLPKQRIRNEYKSNFERQKKLLSKMSWKADVLLGKHIYENTKINLQ